MTEPKPTRESIFHDAARRMRAEFEDARNNVPHRGEAGAEGEAIVREFLNTHLPQRFRATSGFIIDKTDQISGHEDVIVYDALNCPVYRTSERGMIIPNDNVAVLAEVKFQLTTTTLDSAIDKIHEAKNLVKTPRARERDRSRPEIIETYGMIFAFECDLQYQTVIDRWHAKLTEVNPLHNTCSLIAVLDRGLWPTTAFYPGEGVAPVTLTGISPQIPRGAKVGIGYMEFGGRTLDAMMRLLLAHLTFFRHRVDHPGFAHADIGPALIKWIGEFVANGQVAYRTAAGVVLPPTSAVDPEGGAPPSPASPA